jgi:hypothetical protein
MPFHPGREESHCEAEAHACASRLRSSCRDGGGVRAAVQGRGAVAPSWQLSLESRSRLRPRRLRPRRWQRRTDSSSSRTADGVTGLSICRILLHDCACQCHDGVKVQRVHI